MKEIRYYVMLDTEDMGEGSTSFELLAEAIESMKNNGSSESYICVINENHDCEDDTSEIDEISFEKATSMTEAEITEAEASYKD